VGSAMTPAVVASSEPYGKAFRLVAVASSGAVLSGSPDSGVVPVVLGLLVSPARVRWWEGLRLVWVGAGGLWLVEPLGTAGSGWERLGAWGAAGSGL
jgi:hypothetical protein